MGYLRQKRIDLNGIDSRWGDDCHILVGTKGFKEVQSTAREFGKISYQLEKLDILSKKLRNKIEDTDEVEDLLDQLDKYEEEKEGVSENMLSMMLRIAKESFISGVIFDPETGKSKDMVAKDIELLDTEVLTRVTNAVLGNIEKKG